MKLPVERLERKYLDWSGRGSCAGHPEPDLWFPTNRTRKEDVDRAKAICRKCPVKDECYEYGTVHELVGIWGGSELPGRKRKRRDTRN